MTRGHPAWYDVKMRGRRLEAISRQMNSCFWNTWQKDPELAFGYIDRLIKIEHSIQPYIEAMTGVKQFVKDSKKKMIDGQLISV